MGRNIVLTPEYHKKAFEGRQPAKVCADVLKRWAHRYTHDGFSALASHDFAADVAHLQAGLAAAFNAGIISKGHKALLLIVAEQDSHHGVLVQGANRLTDLFRLENGRLPAESKGNDASSNGASSANFIPLPFLDVLAAQATEWAAEPCPRKKRARKRYQAVLEILECTAAQVFISAAISAICRDGRRANDFLLEGRKRLAFAVQCGGHEPVIIGRADADGWTPGAKLAKQRKRGHLRVARGGAEAIAQWRARYPGTTLNLKNADLRDADLRGADLSGARLVGADLTHARLDDANLAGADLQEAILDGASFDGAHFNQTSLLWVIGKGATFRDADVTRAYFGGATLSGVDFSGAEISKSSFVQARLVRGTTFHAAHLNDVDFSGARRITADFTDAVLDGVCFDDAHIKGATFDPEAAVALELEPAL